VSVLDVAQSSLEIPEGLMNNPVYSSPDILTSASLHELVCYFVEINTAMDIL